MKPRITMTNEITIRQTASTLPAPLRNELQIIRTSPKQYYDVLKPERVSDLRPDNAPILSQIKRENGFGNAITVLTLAIHEVKEWFNVKCNLNPDQEAMTAEMILDDDNLYDLTLANIKACFRQHIKSAKLYDRLDGNIIINWLREFKSEMANHCETVREGAERENLRVQDKSQSINTVSLEAYISMLEARVANGDDEAKKTLERYRKIGTIPTENGKRRKDAEFARFKIAYLKSKGIK